MTYADVMMIRCLILVVAIVAITIFLARRNRQPDNHLTKAGYKRTRRSRPEKAHWNDTPGIYNMRPKGGMVRKWYKGYVYERKKAEQGLFSTDRAKAFLDKQKGD